MPPILVDVPKWSMAKRALVWNVSISYGAADAAAAAVAKAMADRIFFIFFPFY